MPYVVIDNCQACKYTDCVLVCPVDCFYELDDQLVISDECIDCGACVPECPVEAIYPEDEVPEDKMDAIEFNLTQAEILINKGIEPIVDQKEPLPTAEAKKAELGF